MNNKCVYWLSQMQINVLTIPQVQMMIFFTFFVNLIECGDLQGHIIELMGCVDSTVHTPSLFTNLKPTLKERLRDIIANDDIAALVQFQSVQNCPSNVELSESGVRWTTLHFCCRFDSPCCLDYFLKKCFLQEGKHYPFFVNQQTAEGLTPLHLCGIWSAYRCTVLLLRYGALNLALREKRHKTAQAVMGQYGLRAMENLLADLKAKEGCITQWNFEFLQKVPDVAAMCEDKFYKQEISRIEQKLRAKVGKSIRTVELTADQTRLREEKGNLQKEKEEIHCELMEKEKQAGRQQKEKQKNQANSNGKIQESKKSEEIQALEQRLKSKEEEIERIKYCIQKLSSEKNDQLLLQQIQKLDVEKSQITTSIQKLMDDFQTFKQDILKNPPQQPPAKTARSSTAFKHEPYRRSKFSDTSSKYPEISTVRKSKLEEVEDLKKELNVDKNIFNRLPQHIQERYRNAKDQGHFEDEEFPHNESSLGGQEHEAKIKPFISSLVWLRPSHFLSPDFELFDGIDPNDIKQGQLGVCYCLATISEYARTPKKIVEIFAYSDLELGFYVLRFYINGKPKYIVVDDYFPCSSVSQQPLFTKPIGNEIWVLLIEKAWAKVIGSYFAAQLMTPDFFMQDLTGSPTYGAWFKDKPDKMRDIIRYSSKNYLIVLTTGSKRIQGIVNNHAYSLLRVIEHNGAYIYKLRNPWGRFEWNGCYGEQSTLWTPELKLKCEETGGDDGIFFLSQSQVLQAYEYYSIGLDEQSAKYSYIQFNSNPEESVYFRFTLAQTGMMSVKLTQPFKRIVKDKDYKYSPVVFQMGKIGDNTVSFLSEGSTKCFFGEKSVYASNQIYKQYEAGEYFVRIKVQWNNPTKYNSAVLSVYCGELITLERIDQPKGLSIWNKMVMDFIQSKRLKQLNEDLSYAMQWMRGQMICYTVFRESSKLDSVKVRWSFNANQLQNCSLTSQKASDNTLEFSMDRTNKSNFGTLTRIDLSKGCKSGSVSIQSIKH